MAGKIFNTSTCAVVKFSLLYSVSRKSSVIVWKRVISEVVIEKPWKVFGLNETAVEFAFSINRFCSSFQLYISSLLLRNLIRLFEPNSFKRLRWVYIAVPAHREFWTFRENTTLCWTCHPFETKLCCASFGSKHFDCQISNILNYIFFFSCECTVHPLSKYVQFTK